MSIFKKFVISVYSEVLFWYNIFLETYKKAISEKKSFLSLSNYLFFEKIYFNILKNNDYLIVDVGANDGWFAKSILHFDDEADIISYEPLKSQVENLKKLKNYKNFDFKSVALGMSVDRLELKEYNTTSLSSLLNLKDGQYKKIGFSTNIKEKYDVCVTTLDKELVGVKKKIFLKIDVQGFEMEVLRGAASLFDSNKIDVVLIELVNREKYAGQTLAVEIINFLNKYNFVIFDLHPFYYEDDNGQLSEFDALFVNKNYNLV